MNEESAKAIEGFYRQVIGLPYAKPKDIRLISGGTKEKRHGKFFNNLIASSSDNYYGFFGRIKLWRELILPFYHRINLQEIAGNSGLEARVTNHFFRSRIVIKDKANHYKLVIKSPKFASLMSYWFGNLVRAKLYKYHSRESDIPSAN